MSPLELWNDVDGAIVVDDTKQHHSLTYVASSKSTSSPPAVVLNLLKWLFGLADNESLVCSVSDVDPCRSSTVS